MPRRCSVRFLSWPEQVLIVFLTASVVGLARGQEPLRSGITVRTLTSANGTPVRIDYDQTSGALYYMTLQGDIYRVDPPLGSQSPRLAYNASAHGISSSALGFAIAPDGRMFVVGSQPRGSLNRGIIARGTPDGAGSHTWSTVARTELYPTSGTAFDHNYNGVVVSPDGADLYVNSGSRTDHGEVQDNGGLFPDEREVSLTSAIFRIPADASDLTLPADEPSLRDLGYLFADGVRNSFDLAFDAIGNLFATENAADRSDTEELNWIREGHHYGFPWRIGTNDMPQQFSDYDPDQDLLLPESSIAVDGGFYRNDPAYPPPPDGVVFTDPIVNLGPDADKYVDETDGTIRDGGGVGTFTPHRSPLGLVFDTRDNLPGEFAGKAFVLSWTSPSDRLLSPFGDEGGDLLMLDLRRQGDGYEAVVERIVRGFSNPIDAVLVGNVIYVLEFGGNRRILEISFGGGVAVDERQVPESVFGLSLYPNPTSSVATITVDGSDAKIVRVEVFDLLGRRVYGRSGAAPMRGAPVLFEWDASMLSPGVYVVRANSGRGSATHRLAVVR